MILTSAQSEESGDVWKLELSDQGFESASVIGLRGFRIQNFYSFFHGSEDVRCVQH